MLDEVIIPPATSDNTLASTLNYLGTKNWNLDGNLFYLKQDKSHSIR